MKDSEWVRGVKAAAAVASDYDHYSGHDHLVSDCILGKLNVDTRKHPRKNPTGPLYFAAPELLAACKAALKKVRGKNIMGDECEPELVAQLSAAIAKTETKAGRSKKKTKRGKR